jgi:hypothetical protein
MCRAPSGNLLFVSSYDGYVSVLAFQPGACGRPVGHGFVRRALERAHASRRAHGACSTLHWDASSSSVPRRRPRHAFAGVRATASSAAGTRAHVCAQGGQGQGSQSRRSAGAEAGNGWCRLDVRGADGGGCRGTAAVERRQRGRVRVAVVRCCGACCITGGGCAVAASAGAGPGGAHPDGEKADHRNAGQCGSAVPVAFCQRWGDGPATASPRHVTHARRWRCRSSRPVQLHAGLPAGPRGSAAQHDGHRSHGQPAEVCGTECRQQP